MKENKVFIARGGVSYIAPECELIELDTTATLCQASGTGTFDLPLWEDDGFGSLDF